MICRIKPQPEQITLICSFSNFYRHPIITHLIVHPIQESRHGRYDGRPEGFHVLGQPLNVTAVEADGSAHHVHGVLATTFQHMRQRQEADHRVRGHQPMVAHLHHHRTYGRHDVLMRQHDALGIAGGAGRVAYRAEIVRRRRQFRMILLGTEALDVVELVQFDAAVLRSLVCRRPRRLHHHQLP